MAQNLFANSAGTDRASLQDWMLEAGSRTLTMREICAGLLQSEKEVPNKTNQWTSLRVDHIPRFVQNILVNPRLTLRTTNITVATNVQMRTVGHRK